jgi:hypothetical protein
MPVRTRPVLRRAEHPSSQHFQKSFLPLSHFYGFFYTKLVIHEYPTVQTQIRLRKRRPERDPSTRVYVSTDWFEVFS